MDVTVDASVLIAVIGNEPSRERAIALAAGHSLLAPQSVHWEIGNALSAMLKRQRVSLAQALACIDAYRQIPIRLVDLDLRSALVLAEPLRVYAYDAYLLACARQFHTPLMTLDEPLKAAAATLGISVLEV